MKPPARPSAPAPSAPSPSKEDVWLYVPDEEVPEALSLGARLVEGDARLVIPNPIPATTSPKAFARWRTDEARYRWCLNVLSSVLGERVVAPDPEVLMAMLGEGAESHDRVYLYVAAYDATKVHSDPGVQWDRRRRMFYATPEANLSRLYTWLTPAARQAWEAEQTLQRSLTHLVQERARKEAVGAGSGVAGRANLGRPAATSRFVRQPSANRGMT